MAFEHKPGSFSLFKNDKGDNDKRPDYRGDGMDLNGQPIEVAAWLKKGNKGTFMSCTMKPAQGAKPAEKKPSGGSKFDDMESDIPF
jgi:hypothetical protein